MLKEILKGKLPAEELELVPSSFDVIGSKEKAVAIVEIPEELKHKEKMIAEAIMEMQKSVKSVLKKTSERKGDTRIREFELIAGDANTEVIHKENGHLLKLDSQKVYFSSREATERRRIAGQVKPGETVLVMFSGIAPFPIEIAKSQPDVDRIYGIELNEAAHNYGIENVRMNKIAHKIVLIQGDAREVCQRFFDKCDRVLMPLPLGAENFLDVAIKCLKEKGIVHFYNWGREDDLYTNALNLIENATKEMDVKFEVLSKRKVLA